MGKYIIIEADTNDGDYVSSYKKISDEEIDAVKNILSKMPAQNGNIRYETLDVGNDDRKNSTYQYISSEEKITIGRFLPYGDPNYQGIHTIVSVLIAQELEFLL